jgi:hypothetical protein
MKYLGKKINSKIRSWPHDWASHIIKTCQFYLDGTQNVPMECIAAHALLSSPVICAETWDPDNIIKIDDVQSVIECGYYIYIVNFLKHDGRAIESSVYRIEREAEDRSDFDLNDYETVIIPFMGKKLFVVYFIGSIEEQSAYDCISGIEELIIEDYWRNQDDDDDNDDDFDPILDPSNSKNLQSSFS